MLSLLCLLGLHGRHLVHAGAGLALQGVPQPRPEGSAQTPGGYIWEDLGGAQTSLPQSLDVGLQSCTWSGWVSGLQAVSGHGPQESLGCGHAEAAASRCMSAFCLAKSFSPASVSTCQGLAEKRSDSSLAAWQALSCNRASRCIYWEPRACFVNQLPQQ